MLCPKSNKQLLHETYLFTTLFFIVTSSVIAQRTDTPWQINAGLNIVDIFPSGGENSFFPNQGGFLKIFSMVIIGMLVFQLLVEKKLSFTQLFLSVFRSKEDLGCSLSANS